jgi:hypothetical protein
MFISIIILFITFMKSALYTCKNHVSGEYSVADLLYLQFVPHLPLFRP